VQDFRQKAFRVSDDRGQP